MSGQRPGLVPPAPQPATDLKYTIEFKSDQEKNNLVEAIKRQWGQCSVDVFAAEQVGAVSEKLEKRVGRIAVDYD